MIDTSVFSRVDARTWWIAVLAVAIAMVVAAFAIGTTRRAHRRRTAMLQERFGPEYERALDDYGTKGEHVLQKRLTA